ncbi:MAG TPA: response regulator [Chthoniobacteraceae bacterium]|nr:response regulator [Chthoniobacteraceae bacterium]
MDNEQYAKEPPIRIVYVEDNPCDRKLVESTLHASGLNCEFMFVETELDFCKALEETKFDLILSDFTLPAFSGEEALAISQALRSDIPFIFVSGTIGADRAVKMLKEGATDYVIKNNLEQLAPAVRRALRERHERAEHLRAVEQLHASEERFRDLAETIQEVFWMTDPAKNQMLYISPAYERIWGRSCQSLYDQPASWLDAIHPEDREQIKEATKTQHVDGAYDEEYRIVRPDGQIRWIRDKAFSVRDAEGHVSRVVGVARDITEQRVLAEQLRQSQKMEAVGQLAGGVAHDFNNLLAVIMMHADMAAGNDSVPDEARDSMREILLAAERAAGIINQLLLFSRKQVMQARNLDLNEVVTNLSKMLQRFIGEDIHMQMHLNPSELITWADAGMLDQVLMNLAVNARDAMPGGGTLVIETSEKNVDDDFARVNADARQGRYVCLSVHDTGAGISPAILPRIFEPFFTTKEPGKGTGLGLATVFGIVKQHRGFLAVESEPGRGTTFQIYLPAVCAAADPATEKKKTKPRGTGQTILLVEDDEEVRMVTRMALEQHGYRVIEAGDGVAALKICENEPRPADLLLTDLVMPAALSGQELSARLQRQWPKLKVIFVSGYSAEIAGRQIELKSGENFLQKPFALNQLLATIRRSLDG